MGTWSGEPFGNDTAADFAYDLDDQQHWAPVAAAFGEIFESDEDVDSDVACCAIAAAEVVAHGLGRPTQADEDTEGVQAFVKRAGAPSPQLVADALRAVEIAIAPEGELSELWTEADPQEWHVAIQKLLTALGAR